MEWLNQPLVAGNAAWQILALFGLLLTAFVVGKLANVLLLGTATRAETAERLVFAATARTSGRAATPVLAAFGLSWGIRFLVLPEGAGSLFTTISDVLVVLAIGYFLYLLIDVPMALLHRRALETESKMDDMLVPVLGKTMRATLVVLVLVQIAQVVSNQPITSILAGLGIGGLAVALAAQDTIKNFFGSLVILADKPFELGDRILFKGYDGPVTGVGLRSTKMQTLTGHTVTIPNSEMANSPVENIGKRPSIRRLFNVTVTYDTPPDKLREAKAILEDILKDHEGLNAEFPPRVYFNDLNSDSLNFLCIYWYFPPNYFDFLAFTERVNLQIVERFNAAGIDFAFPTQTVHLAGDPGRPLNVGVSQLEPPAGGNPS